MGAVHIRYDLTMRRAVKNIPLSIGLANPSHRGGMGRLLVLSLVLLLASCQPKVEHGGKHPVVQVNTNFLYLEDLEKLLPYGISGADSVKLVRELTRKWVEDQVLYNKAEHNVRGDGRIEQLVADYRRKLILNDYEQRLIQQKMSEEVTEEELVDYYENNKQLFILEEPVIKGVFIKAPLKSSGLKDLKRWYKDNSEESLEQLEKYALRNAVIHEHFYDRWLPVSELEGKITVNLSELGKDFDKNRNIEAEDEEYCYLLHIEEYITEGEPKPYDMAKPEIMDLLANIRRVEFMKKVKKDLYDQSLEKGKIKYYDNETEIVGDTVSGTYVGVSSCTK